MKTIVVTGATGKQGGATARHLVARGWQVRALTRNPSAQVTGAETVVADLDDPGSLDRAMAGAYGVFSVQPAPHDPRAPQGYDTSVETRWGKNVADAASRAGVEHLVYASLMASTSQTGVPSFDSKWEVEEHIRSLGQPSTVLRPGTFMDGLHSPGMTKLTHLLDPDTRYQLIAVDDIGAIAASVFASPDLVGTSLALAGDELTPREIAAAMGVEYEQFQVDDPALAKVFAHREEPRADIALLRRIHPGLLTFAAFLSGVRGSFES
ncbi:NmrA/HSCARG family protein [Lentzea tibetensis]|uniref:NmrA/HSCARG family protein n=1 Tax=Lentzea tibetensis TaxID=2591470 RepID=A0A563EJF6_9PSEU|nr:NmrA/HSCARG family protein [Lentzea tibetensis]TWP46507.1 NmrA/HSCARG family protein [Lentzea tibetensis]